MFSETDQVVLFHWVNELVGTRTNVCAQALKKQVFQNMFLFRASKIRHYVCPVPFFYYLETD